MGISVSALNEVLLLLQVSDLDRQQQLGVFFPSSLLEVVQKELLASPSAELQKIGSSLKLELSNFGKLLQDQSSVFEGKFLQRSRPFVASDPTASLLNF